MEFFCPLHYLLRCNNKVQRNGKIINDGNNDSKSDRSNYIEIYHHQGENEGKARGIEQQMEQQDQKRKLQKLTFFMIVEKERKNETLFRVEIKTVGNEYYFFFFLLILAATFLASLCSVTIPLWFCYYLCLSLLHCVQLNEMPLSA